MNTAKTQVSSQELKHHCCRPDLKNKTVLTVVFVKIRFIQISSGTKNPRNGKLSKASPWTYYHGTQEISSKKHPNYKYSSLDFQQIRNDSQFICQSGLITQMYSILIFVQKMLHFIKKKKKIKIYFSLSMIFNLPNEYTLS